MDVAKRRQGGIHLRKKNLVGIFRRRKKCAVDSGSGAGAKSPPAARLEKRAGEIAESSFTTARKFANSRRKAKKIIAVHSADGRQFTAGNFVVCAGAWSGRLLEKLGDAPSIRPIRGQMLLYRPPPKILPCVAKRGDFYLIPRADGLILAGSTLEDAGFDKRTTGEGVRLISAAAAEILPPLGGLSPILQWAGLRPQTPDDSPLTMRDSRFANLYINSGHYRYGVMLSPASAEILANLIK